MIVRPRARQSGAIVTPRRAAATVAHRADDDLLVDGDGVAAATGRSPR
jgi:hypothetical protein